MTGAVGCWCSLEAEAGRAVRLCGAGSGGHCKYQASKRLGKRKASALVLSRWLADGRGLRHWEQLERNPGNQMNIQKGRGLGRRE